MADHFIGMNRGALGTKDSLFTYGTSTGATDVEVRIGDALHLTPKEIYMILQLIADKIIHPDPKITATLFPPPAEGF